MSGTRTVKWVAGGVIGAAVLMFGGAVLWQLRFDGFTVYPTANTQSRFFQTYTPAATIESFDLKKGGSSNSDISSSAGTGAATHKREFNYRFVINAADRLTVAKAESLQASEQLVQSGARIYAAYNPVQGRCVYKYVCGHTIGELVIDPIELDVDTRKDLAADQIAVVARVINSERWLGPEKDAEFVADWEAKTAQAGAFAKGCRP